MGWKGSEEAFLCAVTVSNHDIPVEAALNVWPEQHELWGISELLLGDAVDLLRRPSDFSICVDVGHPSVRE